MAQNDGERPIIIKKKKKGGHGGGHGGAWKVAYADFVTAMMAFFILLWLLNVSTDEEREGLADYFRPTMASQEQEGAGDVLGGQTIAEDGAIGEPKTMVQIDPENVGRQVPGAGPVDQDGDQAGAQTNVDGEQGENAPVQAETDTTQAEDPPDNVDPSQVENPEDIEDAEVRQEEQEFRQAAQELLNQLEGNPDLEGIGDQVMVDRVPEGLRIQLVDQQDFSMFPEGSAVMYERTQNVLSEVASVLRDLDNSISIAGHTDSVPFSEESGYSNWELSTDRANASRRALVDAGVSEDRIANVVGRADRDPLLPEQPEADQNRRISITVLREETGEVADAGQSGVPVDGVAETAF